MSRRWPQYIGASTRLEAGMSGRLLTPAPIGDRRLELRQEKDERDDEDRHCHAQKENQCGVAACHATNVRLAAV
jgi:hypothetical protein